MFENFDFSWFLTTPGILTGVGCLLIIIAIIIFISSLRGKKKKENVDGVEETATIASESTINSSDTSTIDFTKTMGPEQVIDNETNSTAVEPSQTVSPIEISSVNVEQGANINSNNDGINVVSQPINIEPQVIPQPINIEPQVTPQPINVEPQVTPQPINVEPQVTPQPVNVEPQVTPQPINVEPQVTPQPINVEPQVIPQPVNVEPQVTPQPINVEPQVTPQPINVEPQVIPQPVNVEPQGEPSVNNLPYGGASTSVNIENISEPANKVIYGGADPTVGTGVMPTVNLETTPTNKNDDIEAL